MAILTQIRGTVVEQISHEGSMGVVADKTVFRHRRMVVQERAAFFHVTLVAGIVDTVPLQGLVTRRAVGIVAVGADHLSFEHGVMGGTVKQSPLGFVATEADFGLASHIQHPIVIGMNFMTIGTSHFLVGMGTAGPKHEFIPLMAGQTNLINDLRRSRGGFKRPKIFIYAGVEADFWGTSTISNVWLGTVFLPWLFFQMLPTGTMATGAGRRPAIGQRAMLGFADGKQGDGVLLLVTEGAFGIPPQHGILPYPLLVIIRILPYYLTLFRRSQRGSE